MCHWCAVQPARTGDCYCGPVCRAVAVATSCLIACMSEVSQREALVTHAKRRRNEQWIACALYCGI